MYGRHFIQLTFLNITPTLMNYYNIFSLKQTFFFRMRHVSSTIPQLDLAGQFKHYSFQPMLDKANSFFYSSQYYEAIKPFQHSLQDESQLNGNNNQQGIMESESAEHQSKNSENPPDFQMESESKFISNNTDSTILNEETVKQNTQNLDPEEQSVIEKAKRYDNNVSRNIGRQYKKMMKNTCVSGLLRRQSPENKLFVLLIHDQYLYLSSHKKVEGAQEKNHQIKYKFESMIKEKCAKLNEIQCQEQEKKLNEELKFLTNLSRAFELLCENPDQWEQAISIIYGKRASITKNERNAIKKFKIQRESRLNLKQ